MELFTEIVETTVLGFISVIELVIVARCLMSLFISEESKIYQISYAVTEPVVYPVRSLLMKIPAMESFPFDLSFMATYIFLELIRIILLSVL